VKYSFSFSEGKRRWDEADTSLLLNRIDWGLFFFANVVKKKEPLMGSSTG
jgi:hypothetical protein